MTILLTTHYLEEADRLASQLAIVDRGRIVAAGTPDELKSELRGRHDPGRARRRRRRRGAPARSRASTASARSRSTGRTLRARARDGAAAIPAVLAALEAHGVRAASVTLARPSLDDVYLRHAGRAFTRRRRGGGGMTAAPPDLAGHACATCACCVRQPAFLGDHAVQPIIWLLLFGALFKAVTEIPGFARRLLRRLPHARASS